MADGKELSEALRRVMSLPEGRRVMGWVLKGTGMFSSVTAPTAEGTLAASSRRDYGLALLERLDNTCPESVDEMMREIRSGRDRRAAGYTN